MPFLRSAWLFLFFALIGGFFVEKFANEGLGISALYADPAVVPLLVLSFGTWLHLVLLWLTLLETRDWYYSGYTFAPLLGKIDHSDRSRRRWSILTALTVVVFPLILFAYFWVQFEDGRQVWSTPNQNRSAMLEERLTLCRKLGHDVDTAFPFAEETRIGAWTPVPACLVWGGWNAFQYGDYNADSDPNRSADVSILPFWQPLLLMAFPTGLCILLGAATLVRLRPSNPSPKRRDTSH
jgi:hypothetical protein